jgi:hypothetical protein
MAESASVIEGWAILELMGHRRLGPTTEEIARAIARGAPQLVSRWDLHALEARTSGQTGDIVDVDIDDDEEPC